MFFFKNSNSSSKNSPSNSLSQSSSMSSSSRFENSIESLYEISHIPNENVIPQMDLPIVNPYNVFAKPTPNSFTRQIKKLVSSKSSEFPIKEYVQKSKFES
ncbi:hypothetical protein LguiB_028415 [Lonicera macranthoides]